jgi:hypothetical protein
MADIDNSTLRNQHYGMKLQLRPKKGVKWSANTTVIAVIETIDQSNEKPVYVGTAAFPMYLIASKGTDW